MSSYKGYLWLEAEFKSLKSSVRLSWIMGFNDVLSIIQCSSKGNRGSVILAMHVDDFLLIGSDTTGIMETLSKEVFCHNV